MKRTLAIIPISLLTVLMVSKPQRNSDSFPFRVPPKQDTAAYQRTTPDTAANSLASTLDSTRKKAALLKEKTDAIRQGSVQLERDTRKLLQQVNKERDTPDGSIVIINPDTVFVPQKAIVVRDTTLDHKTWWGKFFATNKRLIKQCKWHKKFARK